MAGDDLTDGSKCIIFWYLWYLGGTKFLKSLLNLQWKNNSYLLKYGYLDPQTVLQTLTVLKFLKPL